MQRAIFRIPGEPVGKGRPQFNGNQHRAYTPEKTRNYEDYVKWVYKAKNKGVYFEDQPLRVYISAFFKIPKSAGIKRSFLMSTHRIRPTKKPDVDNIAKIICDALNGLAYKDDSQIVECIVRKYYAEEPKVDVVIENLIEESENED